MILLCSGKILYIAVLQQDVIMTSNCIYDIIYFFICTVESINGIREKSLASGWLVGCLGLNSPLRLYFSLYRAVSQREKEKENRSGR